jgi:4-amino-4-deoxy-L-arabinose transferase-like glycosyltransferase
VRYRFFTLIDDERRRARWSGSERTAVALLALLLLAAIAYQLGSRALFEPDEGRNAEVMREMSASGDYFVPRLNGLLFLDKPFLYYAAGGLAMRAIGGGELAARLPGALCTLLLGVATGLLARRWWGGRAGLLAGIATVTAPLPLLYSQIVIFDAMLTLWMCLALVAFHRAVESEAGAGGPTPRIWSALAWIAMALGTLTKGPVALLIPLAAVLPWAIWRRRARRLVAGGAPLYALALLLPWIWAVSRADPDFLHYALVTETWSRLSSNELKRDAPVWYYLPVALFGILPWSIVPLAGARRVVAAWRTRVSEVRFLALWFAAPFVIFSLLHSKRVHYILPLVPALVLLSLWLWAGTAAGARLPGVRAAGVIWASLGAALLAVGLGAAPRLLARVDGVPVETVTRVAVALGLAWSLAGLVALFSSRSLLRAFCALTLPPMALLLLSAPLNDAVGERRSARALARELARSPAAASELVAVETFPASLPFYLDRTLVVASTDGAPLRSNYVLRRYAQQVGDSAPLRSPAWLDRVVSDCATPRTFVLRNSNSELAARLAAAGRRAFSGGRDLVVYGPCAAPAQPVPAPDEAGRVPL